MDGFLLENLVWPAFLAVAGYFWKIYTEYRNHQRELERAARAEKREMVRKYLVELDELLNHQFEEDGKAKANRILSVKASLNELFLRAKPDTVAKLSTLFHALIDYSNWKDKLRKGMAEFDPETEEKLLDPLNSALLAAVNAARGEFGADGAIAKEESLCLIYLEETKDLRANV